MMRLLKPIAFDVMTCMAQLFDFYMYTVSMIYSPYRFNPFPNKPWFLRDCSTSLLKTLWEKEKLLVTSNFSFSHSVFYTFGELSGVFNKLKIVIVCKPFEFGRVDNLSFWKGLMV